MMNRPGLQDHPSEAFPDDNDSSFVDERLARNMPQNQPSGDITSQFPWRLHQMLKTVEIEGSSSIISWIPGEPQDTFKVHKKEEFMEKYMSRFFNQTKFKSFLRQLNLWGFERIHESGPGRGGYRHSLFIKNRPDLCSQMKRTRIKGMQRGDSGDSKERLARLAQGEPLSNPRKDDGPQKPPAKNSDGSPDNTSMETIEYEKMSANVPVAAELSRMYAQDMKTLHESSREDAEDESLSAQNLHQL